MYPKADYRPASFLLTIRSLGRGEYHVQVRGAPAGDVEKTFSISWDQVVPPTWFSWLGRRQVAATFSQGSAATAQMRRLGGQLFRALPEEIRSCFWISLERVGTVRLLLDLRDPELAVLPWEWLYDPDREAFLACSPSTPVIRYLSLPLPPEPWPQKGPWRVLFVSGLSPDKEGALGDLVQHNLDMIDQLVERGLLLAKVLIQPSLDYLHQELAGDEYQILHILSHGYRSGGIDCLGLSQPNGKEELLSGEVLAALLSDVTSLKLALLTACRSGEEGWLPPESFHSPPIVRALLQAGLLAVIAIQGYITAPAAQAFNAVFYEALSQGDLPDVAVTRGRATLAVEHPLEWSAPIFYARAIALSPTPSPIRLMRRWITTIPRRVKATAALVLGAILLTILGLQLSIPMRVAGYQRQGLELLDQGNISQAIAVFKEGLRLDPDNGPLLYNLGNAYEYLPLYERAKEYYELAIAADFSLDLAYNNLARLYLKVDKNCDEAMRLLDLSHQVLQDEYVLPAWYKNMGWAYLCKQEYNAAQEYLLFAISIDQDQVEAYYLLGQVDWALGNPCQAQEGWLHFLEQASPAYYKLERNQVEEWLEELDCPEER